VLLLELDVNYDCLQLAYIPAMLRWRHNAIASSLSEVWSKASVGLFAMLVARFNSQLFLDTKFNPAVQVVDSIVFVH
jgi:hypothetical protein